MDISSLDITMSRIREIETRISRLDQKFGQIFADNNNSTKAVEEKSFDKTLDEIIEKHSKKNNIDEDLVKAVIKTESNFNKDAVSHAGAQGLMQLMPQTALGLGVDDPFNPEDNIAGGTKYLSNLINRYDSVELGLAAYNAGPGSVNKYGGIPPYKETQNYVQSVLKYQKEF